jgi:hypothetical protein
MTSPSAGGLKVIVLRGSPALPDIAEGCDLWEAVGMPTRNLKIVKLTPIAIGVCEFCDFHFHSSEPIEDSAERDIRRKFVDHECLRMGGRHKHAKTG